MYFTSSMCFRAKFLSPVSGSLIFPVGRFHLPISSPRPKPSGSDWLTEGRFSPPLSIPFFSSSFSSSSSFLFLLFKYHASYFYYHANQFKLPTPNTKSWTRAPGKWSSVLCMLKSLGQPVALALSFLPIFNRLFRATVAWAWLLLT